MTTPTGSTPETSDRTYRLIALALAIVFAAVGALFLTVPGAVLRFFSDISVEVGLEPSSTGGVTLYLVLAVAYMYLVTLLAWMMYRRTGERLPAVLLVNAKLASSILSLVIFLSVERTLIFLVNGVVDGLIGAGVALLFLQPRRRG